MSEDTNTQKIEALVEKLLAEMDDIFLVEVRVNPTNNIKVYLDADAGLNIDKCVKINRGMYRTIEEEGWYEEGNFSLEVSSPGIDEPLRLIRQYKKNVGRTVQVTLSDDTNLEGKLTAVTEEGFQIEFTEGKNKKAINVSKEILFDQVKQTIVIIAF